MSAVDDLRKLLQGTVSPDLKALDVRVVALDKKLDFRVDALDKKIDALDKKLDMKIDMTRDLLVSEMRTFRSSVENDITRLVHAFEMDRRLTRLENERAQPPSSQPPAQLERTA